MKLDRYKSIGILSLIIVISGIFGWVYEFIFYYFNGGMKEFYWRGGNFLPWINIYAIGAVLILIMTKRFQKKPLMVFLISMVVTGVLEYISGYLIYELQNGTRYWDYNTEILNFGNINGFICLRSVLFFGISALILVYLIKPFCIKIAQNKNSKKFMIICLIIVSIFLLDEFYNLYFHKLLNLPRAIEIYKSIGFHFM
ncbi:MAG: putative ABC transporter permease [Bacilli bacterium]|nr:putative ABC transporter permease [Bacilli bacterium]